MLKLKKSIASIIDTYNSGDESAFTVEGIPEIRISPNFRAGSVLRYIRKAITFLTKGRASRELQDLPLDEAVGLRPPRILIERGSGLVLEAGTPEQLLMSVLLLGLITPTSKGASLVLIDLINKCRYCRNVFLAKNARGSGYCSKKCRNRDGYISRKKKGDQGA